MADSTDTETDTHTNADREGVVEALAAVRDRFIRGAGLNRFARYGVPYRQVLMLLQLTVIVVVQAVSLGVSILPVVGAVGAALVVGSVYRAWQYPRYMVPGGALITALIVAGIVLSGDVVAAAGVTVLALGLKYVIRPGGRNVFNPAALGLYVAALVFGVGLTWWGAGSVLVLVLGVVTAYLVKVHDILFSFLVPYWLLTFLLVPETVPQSAGAVVGLAQSYVTFFAVIMVVEPVTSPDRQRSRVAYGLGVAVIAATLPVIASVLPAVVTQLFVDHLLLALLVMNAVHRVLPDRYMA